MKSERGQGKINIIETVILRVPEDTNCLSPNCPQPVIKKGEEA